MVRDEALHDVDDDLCRREVVLKHGPFVREVFDLLGTLRRQTILESVEPLLPSILQTDGERAVLALSDAIGEVCR